MKDSERKFVEGKYFVRVEIDNEETSSEEWKASVKIVPVFCPSWPVFLSTVALFTATVLWSRIPAYRDLVKYES